jgi:TonB family protein
MQGALRPCGPNAASRLRARQGGFAAKWRLTMNSTEHHSRRWNRMSFAMSQTVSTPNRLWEKLEGRQVDGKFRLQRWLGGSDHSIVFLTERTGTKAAIKLIPGDKSDSDEQISRWAATAKVSHPHLIRLFEYGSCQIDGTLFLYVVMEYGEENLAEVLPLRALSSVEVSEMLGPAAEALATLHHAGFVHGSIRPSNVMAVDNQLKLSADGLGRSGDHVSGRAGSGYDAPEIATVGSSAAADMWSLGMTLLAVLTQSEPKREFGDRREVTVPAAIPQPVNGIVQRCLEIDPVRRCTVNDILKQFSPRAFQTQPVADPQSVERHSAQNKPKRWIIVLLAAAALLVVAWIGGKMVHRQPAIPASETPALGSKSNVVADSQPTAPSPGNASSANNLVKKGIVPGSVLQQVLPEVSRGAQNTIRGRVKVSVQVTVDASGNVSEAKLTSPGPSRYFAARALAAARRWRFNPPEIDGKAAASDWVLRFHFGRTSTQVFPTEIKP